MKHISDGAVLPENHGRLIDADEVIQAYKEDFNKKYPDMDFSDLAESFKEQFLDRIFTVLEGTDV